MSHWTHIKGSIDVDGINTEGIIKLFKIKQSKNKDKAEYQFDNFVNNLNNFTIIKHDNYIVKDYREKVRDFIAHLPEISGSEGRAEYLLGFYENSFKLWGFGNSSSTRTLDKKQNRLVSEVFEEKHKDKNLVDVWETSFGDRFNLYYYGDMRDRELEDTCKEVIEVIKEINKYFRLNDIDITVIGDSGNETRFTLDYTKNYDLILKIHTVNINVKYDDDYNVIKRSKTSSTKIINLKEDKE